MFNSLEEIIIEVIVGSDNATSYGYIIILFNILFMIGIQQIHDSQLNKFKLLILKTKIFTVFVETSFNGFEQIISCNETHKILFLEFVFINAIRIQFFLVFCFS